MINMKRTEGKEKGVLLPVFSLPSRYGIGCFSREAREFVDWLAETGHAYWQILPLNPTGVADSPYQPLSSFAGNAYFIDPAQLVEQGLIQEWELEDFYFGEDPERVEYEVLYESRMELLRLAYRRFTAQRLVENGARAAAESADAAADAEGQLKEKRTAAPAGTHAAGTHAAGTHAAAEPDALAGRSRGAYEKFLADNAFWLEDYALFMALREEFGKELSWDEWPDPLRWREAPGLARAAEQYGENIGFYCWTQYEFYRQWAELKAYANAAGVKIIGDMPVYVSYDSADCWAAPEQFQLDEDLQPTMIAGVPPDDFAEEGQLWGNPLYDWEKMRLDGYAWWVSRIRQSFLLYDVIRLDHFRGYEAYYSCEADAVNGMHGIWRKGPGMDLFRRLEEEHVLPESDTAAASGTAAGTAAGSDTAAASGVSGARSVLSDRFIAEDLGFLTDGVHRLLKETGFPGTKVLQFAFDGDPENMYLPENYRTSCVVYTGTHDNDTTVGWFRKLNQDDRAGILQYVGYSGIDAWWLVLESDAALLRGEKLAQPAGGTAPKDPLSAEMKDSAVMPKDSAVMPKDSAVMPKDSAGETIDSSVGSRVRRVDHTKPVPDPAILATDGLIEKAMDSTAKIAIIPLQDYLHLGGEARINVPGTVVNNWCWRVAPGSWPDPAE